MIILIDNYDSFTWNLWHYLGEIQAPAHVIRNDAASVDEIMAQNPQGIVLSPGPGSPDKAGICLDLIERAAPVIPILGVCLGHQSIAQVFGGRIVRSPAMMHGKTSPISHDGTEIFQGIPSPFTATRYHSLGVAPDSVPDCLRVIARSDDDEIQAITHKEWPVYGVQFHPESIASEYGHALLKNFIATITHNVAA